MPHCFVIGCKISDRNSKSVSFHAIRKNCQEEWLKLIGRPIDTFVIQQKVCSRHFYSADFESYGRLKKLKLGAIPSRYLPSKDETVNLETEASISKCKGFEESNQYIGNLQKINVEASTSKCKGFQESNRDLVNLLGSHDDISSGYERQKDPLCETVASESYEFADDSKENEDLDDFEKCILSLPLWTTTQLKKRKLDENPVPSKVMCLGKENYANPSPKSGSSSLKRRFIKTLHTYSCRPERYHKQRKYEAVRAETEKETARSYKRQLRNVKRACDRRLEKIKSLTQIVKDLKQKYELSPSAESMLENTISEVPVAIIKRTLTNKSIKGKITRDKYSAELRSFAMTLQFYNSRAYEYVCDTFELASPAQSTVRAWFALKCIFLQDIRYLH